MLGFFGGVKYQSALERLHAGYEGFWRVDLDGIRHSFEGSTSSFGPSVSPFGMTAFRISQEATDVDITGEAESGEGAGFLVTATEGNETADLSQNVTLDVPVAKRPNLSPFSMFLNRSRSPVPVAPAQISCNKIPEHLQVCLTPLSRYVTFDLETLERRF